MECRSMRLQERTWRKCWCGPEGLSAPRAVHTASRWACAVTRVKHEQDASGHSFLLVCMVTPSPVLADIQLAQARPILGAFLGRSLGEGRDGEVAC